jgi:hypothetical protein
MAEQDAVIDWLLEGDPAIRWQVMRDLLDEPAETWQEERSRTVERGWITELLEHKGPDGESSGGTGAGAASPRSLHATARSRLHTPDAGDHR